jgi:hypothetical protein
VAKVSYLIAVQKNFQMRDYVADLESSMNLLAPEVAANLNISSSDDGGRRRLTVSVDLPTSIDGVIISSKSDE